MGWGRAGVFQATEVEILSEAVQVGPIISIVFDFKAPKGQGQIAHSKYARPCVIK